MEIPFSPPENLKSRGTFEMGNIGKGETGNPMFPFQKIKNQMENWKRENPTFPFRKIANPMFPVQKM